MSVPPTASSLWPRGGSSWDHRNRLTSITTLAPREVARWRFDTAASNVTIDSIGSLDGTLTNGAAIDTTTAWPNNSLGGSLAFDGVNDYVSMGAQAALEIGSDDFSIAFWFKTSTASTAGLFGQGNPYNGGEGYDVIYRGGSTKNIEVRLASQGQASRRRS